MRLLLLLIASLPLAAQDLPVIHFTPQEAALLRHIAKSKAYWEKRWQEAETFILDKYTKEPGEASAGSVSLGVDSNKSPWQYGLLFSQDYEVAAPKPAPKESCN